MRGEYFSSWATVIEGCWWWLRVVLGGTALPSLGEGLGGFSPYRLLFTPISTTLHLLASGGGGGTLAQHPRQYNTAIMLWPKMELEDRERAKVTGKGSLGGPGIINGLTIDIRIRGGLETQPISGLHARFGHAHALPLS